MNFCIQDEEIIQDDLNNTLLKSRILKELRSGELCDMFYCRIHALAHITRNVDWESRFPEGFGDKIGENITTVSHSFGNKIGYEFENAKGDKIPLCDIDFRIVNSITCLVAGVNTEVAFRRLGVGKVLYDIFEDVLRSQGIKYIYGNMSEAGTSFVQKRGRIALADLEQEARIRMQRILGTGITPNHQFDNVYFKRIDSH